MNGFLKKAPKRNFHTLTAQIWAPEITPRPSGISCYEARETGSRKNLQWFRCGSDYPRTWLQVVLRL